MADDRIVFVRDPRKPECGSSVRWVSGNGERTGVLAGGLGYVDAVTASADGSTVAFSYEPCNSDLPSQVRVLDVSTGDVILDISNAPGFNGSLGAAGLMLVQGRLVVLVGVHLTTWLASVDLTDPEATELADLPRLPFPDKCRLTNAVAEGDSSVVGITSCGRETRVYHLAGPHLDRFRLGPEVQSDGNNRHLTSATGNGYLIGTLRVGGREAVFQMHQAQERILPMCSSREWKRGEWCSYTPVWGHPRSLRPKGGIDMHSTSFDRPGIKNEVDAPAPSIQFTTNNAWTGWFGGDYLAVYAGDAGYDHPRTGKVMVFTYDDDRTTRLGYTRTLQGTGALKVIAVDKPVITLRGRDGETYLLHLDSQSVETPQSP